MDINFKNRFIKLWGNYFPGCSLPIVFYYADEKVPEYIEPSEISHCVIPQIYSVLKKGILCLNTDIVKCFGGKRYLGFSQSIRPDFEYFLSCGIPGKLEGERYKKSPEIVMESMKHIPTFSAPGKYIVFKRFDILNKTDNPIASIFFAEPDVISGLYTLANFDEVEQAVIAPFGSGCASVVSYPYNESFLQHPKSILGMFDVSARPYVDENILSFAIPWKKFVSMIDNIEESFLITKSWNKIKKRIEGKR